jgi:hypothetical protein
MSSKTAPVSLKFTGKVPVDGWNELLHGKQLSVKAETLSGHLGGTEITSVSFALQPFEIVVVQAP